MAVIDATRIRRVYGRLRAAYPQASCALRHGDPFQLLVATILSAQCTDAQVNRVTPVLFRRYRNIRDFAGADIRELERIVHATGFYRMKAAHIRESARAVVARFGGRVPDRMEDLVTLPGVGRKTANCVMGNAFGKPGLVVDTHVIRLTNRLGWTKQRDPVNIERAMTAVFPPRDWTDFGHVLIAHGRAICRARKPLCGKCPVRRLCPSAGKFGSS
ncbi:MAG: endonuclease III [Planctomycetota bacterium]